MSKKITLESISAGVLQKMRAEVGNLVERYVFENIEDTSAKFQNLCRRYEETCGYGSLLLSDRLPLRVKFYLRGRYCNISFIAEISGAENYLVVYDCRSKKMRIEAYSDVSFIIV